MQSSQVSLIYFLRQGLAIQETIIRNNHLLLTIHYWSNSHSIKLRNVAKCVCENPKNFAVKQFNRSLLMVNYGMGKIYELAIDL